MVFQISPGVNFSEIDLTTIVPAVGTTNAGMVGNFVWGPVNEIHTVSSEIDLVNQYGEPNQNNFVDFFTAASFLAYGQNLQIVRANGTPTMLNAVANGAGATIQNNIDYNENYSGGANTHGMWAAKWPGDIGNSLQVSVFPGPNTSAFTSWSWSSYFQGPPTTSTYVSNNGGSNDELHVVVVDQDGRFTGTANTVLEKFAFVSKASDAINDDGTSNYYVNQINQKSKYIWWLSHPDTGIGLANAANWGSASAGGSVVYGVGDNVAYTSSLTNGTFNMSSSGLVNQGYDLFRNPDTVDVSLVLTSDFGANTVNYVIDNIAGNRRDCVVFASPLRASVVNNVGNEATSVVADRNTYTTSSYAFMDSGWKYMYDKYNSVFRWVPLNGDMAGLCVRTDYQRDAWWSPAGFNRGGVLNVTKLSWNPTKTDRDTLYNNGVNPVVTFQGNGTILYGDKTLQSKPSAFDRINVRRLFIVLEKAISRAAKYSLFEFNDAFTRAQFVSLVEPFLRDVQGRRGIFDFRVVCDETNNTPQVIDSNQFVGDIYIKPARSINFIQLNFVAVGTGVDFSEVVGKF